jgi:hypothetical protein
MDGQDTYAMLSIKYWLQQLRLGRETSRHDIWEGDPLSTRRTLKFYRFFGDLLFPQCEQLLTPWAFLRLRSISTWSKRLGSTTPYSFGPLTS